MYIDTTVTITDVTRAVEFLVGNLKGEYSLQKVKEKAKNVCKYTPIENEESTIKGFFHSCDIWENYFLKDEFLSKILAYRRITSMDELVFRSRAWEFDSHDEDGRNPEDDLYYK